MANDDTTLKFKKLKKKAKQLVKKISLEQEAKDAAMAIIDSFIELLKSCKARGVMPPAGIIANAYELSSLYGGELLKKFNELNKLAEEAVENAVNKIFSQDIVDLLDKDPIAAVYKVLYSDEAGKITKKVMDKFAQALAYDPHGNSNQFITNADLSNLHEDISSTLKRESRKDLFVSLHTKWVPLHEMVMQEIPLNDEQRTRKANLEFSMFLICENELVDKAYQKLQKDLEQEKGEKVDSKKLVEEKGAEMFKQYNQVLSKLQAAKNAPNQSHEYQKLFEENAKNMDQREEVKALEKLEQMQRQKEREDNKTIAQKVVESFESKFSNQLEETKDNKSLKEVLIEHDKGDANNVATPISKKRTVQRKPR